MDALLQQKQEEKDESPFDWRKERPVIPPSVQKSRPIRRTVKDPSDPTGMDTMEVESEPRYVPSGYEGAPYAGINPQTGKRATFLETLKHILQTGRDYQ